MTKDPDLSIQMASLKFKSPVLVSSSECASNASQLKDLTHRNIGSIVDWMQKKGYRSVDEIQGKVFKLIKDAGVLKSQEKYSYIMPPDCPYVPVVNEDNCILCGTCAKSCIYGVFNVNEKVSRVFTDLAKCWSCVFCVGVCPADAIELRDRIKREKVIWKNQGIAAPFKF